jgi:hypothetical protein
MTLLCIDACLLCLFPIDGQIALDLDLSGLGQVLFFMSTVLIGLGPYGLAVAGEMGERP